jgi:hypothetical protein
MGSKTKTPTGGDQTKKKTPGEQIRDNFLQFTSGRPNVESRGMTIVYPDGPDLDRTAGINFGFDPFMSKLLAEARSGRNNPPPSQTMPPVMFEGPPSQTMPPVFIPPQAPPSELFKDSVLNTLETVQLPPSVRDKPEEKKLMPLPPPPGGELPAVPIPVPVPTMPGPFLPPPETRPGGFDPENPPRSDRNLLPFMVPLPLGIGSLFREFLESLQEDD